MSRRKTGLGKGIDALIPSGHEELSDSVIEIDIHDIEPGDAQPRKSFDEEKIAQLAQSIKEHGIIQPLIVMKEGSVYKIIAGERRWRAARLAGLKKVPAIERSATPQEVMELALIENIQREDLNPIEEAEAYSRLMTEHNITQERLSEIIGKSRSAIANTIRLLNFNDQIREMIINEEITAGHARAILALESEDERVRVAREVVDKGYNVRQTEDLVKKLLQEKAKKKENKDITDENYTFSQVEIKHIQNMLRSVLGTKVKMDEAKGRGKIIIEYYSPDERERLIDYLTKG